MLVSRWVEEGLACTVCQGSPPGVRGDAPSQTEWASLCEAAPVGSECRGGGHRSGHATSHLPPAASGGDVCPQCCQQAAAQGAIRGSKVGPDGDAGIRVGLTRGRRSCEPARAPLKPVESDDGLGT